MPRSLLVSTTIVAAFQLHLAAATPLVENAPLDPQMAAFATGLDVTPTRDRGRFMADIARRLYPTSDHDRPELPRPGAARAGGEMSTAPFVIPVPLPAGVWSRVIFRRPVPPDQLIAAILRDPRAALLCRGLSGVDDETLTYLAEHTDLLEFLYQRAAWTFAGFADVLRIRDGRIVTPGGAEASPLWEAAIGVPLDDPNRIARAIFGERGGRLAYLLSVVGAAAAPAARFTLGLWIPDPALRAERFRALTQAIVMAYPEWHAEQSPFVRPLGDLGAILVRIQVDASGAPRPPAAREFWGRVFDVSPVISTAAPAAALGDQVDAAWLVSAIAASGTYARSDLLDQFAFAQRVFAHTGSGDRLQIAGIVKRLTSRHMLLVSLERMGITSPDLYAAALRRADALAGAGSSRRFWTLAQYQGALALLVGMRRVGALTEVQGEQLLMSLNAVPLVDGDYQGAVARWMRTSLSTVLPAGGDWETRVIAALSGASDSRRTPGFFWEGQRYRLDTSFAERGRMDAVRRKQGGHSVDLALAIESVATSLETGGATLDVVRASEQTLTDLVEQSSGHLAPPGLHLVPPGVTAPRDGVEWINAAVGDLRRISRPSDLSRAPRVGHLLQPLVDVVLGDALVSIAYAANLGDPDGAALLARNVALRHDFGFGVLQDDGRDSRAWAQPRQDFQPGVPWHVTGSLLGLDIGLATLQLRRLNPDRIPDKPLLSSVEREALAIGVVLMDGARLTDDDRDAIADAVARGRARVRRLIEGGGTAADVAEILGTDGWRQRALQWSLVNAPESVPSQFSLADLLVLGGGPAAADLDSWGGPGLSAYGCVCTRFADSRTARLFDGRYQLPTVATTMGDLNLAVALMLHDLGVPAALARPILMLGLIDAFDGARAAGSGEWWGLSRAAQALSRQQIEDDISALAAVGGPLVPDDSADPSLQE